ncbi:LysR family transcriptional regulator [Microbulbifer echini]|uniref:LysR family transcriptional regulator n=1 Tax=Microbulbifer echini TaxID=1529067 RepID=A0ABV4NJ61_9GAMM|nr:LysR family transcriptional regulator [uncultured Microbulbifer sp.]
MDSFDGVVEFVAVAESQGFSAAAKHLGCSTSHVSRQVSRLEERLGSALLARTTRLVSLTQAGTVYYQRCKELVVGLQQANEQVSLQQYELSGTLRVSCAGIFAEQYVAPALMAFGLEHPDLRIDMDFNSRMVNFVEDGIDFAIRYGRLEDSGLVARKLADRQMMAVASPDYLKQFGRPAGPGQLKSHSCIVANNESWVFDINGAEESIRVDGRWRSNNAHAVVEACEKGLGIAYMPKSSFSRSIEMHLLEPILESFWGRGASSWIVYQNRRFLPIRVRMAIDYLVDYFSDWEE